MALMDILAAAQGGALYANAGKVVDLDPTETAAAMAAMCPAIARQLKAKSQEDPATFETLLDLLEEGADGTVIDDAGALTGSEAIADGNAILVDIYGTRNAAIAEMRKLAGNIPEIALAKLAAVSATLVLGALAKSHVPMALSEAAPAASSNGGGIISMIVAALIKGVMQSVTRQLAPRRRRRYASYATRRRSGRAASKRRARAPSLEDVFGEILGSRRN